MVSEDRARRISQRIQEELAELFLFSVSDPRLDGVQLTDVRVDRELAYANVFVSALEGSERETEILEGLDSAAGFLRYQLSQRIQLRSFPMLRFHWDPMPEHGDRIDRLIASLHQEDDEGEKDNEAYDEE
jgi:ribosome-binding factor A